MTTYSAHDVLRTRLCKAAGCEDDAHHGQLCTRHERARQRGQAIRVHFVEQPAGKSPTTLWCSACRAWKPDEAFYRKANRKSRRNRADECRDCAAKRRAKDRAADPRLRTRERNWKRAQAARKRSQTGGADVTLGIGPPRALCPYCEEEGTLSPDQSRHRSHDKGPPLNSYTRFVCTNSHVWLVRTDEANLMGAFLARQEATP